MNFLAVTSLLLACGLIYASYILITIIQKMLSRPWMLIVFGAIIIFGGVYLARMTEAASLLIAKNNLDILYSKITEEAIFTVYTALGGGLIAGAFLIKAQIGHKEGLRNLERQTNRLERNKKDLKEAIKYLYKADCNERDMQILQDVETAMSNISDELDRLKNELELRKKV